MNIVVDLVKYRKRPSGEQTSEFSVTISQIYGQSVRLLFMCEGTRFTNCFKQLHLGNPFPKCCLATQAGWIAKPRTVFNDV